MTPLDVWEDELTPEIRSLAKHRILDGGNLATRSDLSKRTIKLVLVLVRQLNPPEDLSDEEFAIVMGISSTTFRKLRQQKEFLQMVNR
jgi:hypothetical protein